MKFNKIDRKLNLNKLEKHKSTNFVVMFDILRAKLLFGPKKSTFSGDKMSKIEENIKICYQIYVLTYFLPIVTI